MPANRSVTRWTRDHRATAALAAEQGREAGSQPPTQPRTTSRPGGALGSHPCPEALALVNQCPPWQVFSLLRLVTIKPDTQRAAAQEETGHNGTHTHRERPRGARKGRGTSRLEKSFLHGGQAAAERGHPGVPLDSPAPHMVLSKTHPSRLRERNKSETKHSPGSTPSAPQALLITRWGLLIGC